MYVAAMDDQLMYVDAVPLARRASRWARNYDCEEALSEAFVVDLMTDDGVSVDGEVNMRPAFTPVYRHQDAVLSLLKSPTLYPSRVGVRPSVVPETVTVWPAAVPAASTAASASGTPATARSLA